MNETTNNQTQPSQIQIMIKNPDGSFATYDITPSLSGRKATLILDGTEHTVTFE